MGILKAFKQYEIAVEDFATAHDEFFKAVNSMPYGAERDKLMQLVDRMSWDREKLYERKEELFEVMDKKVTIK